MVESAQPNGSPCQAPTTRQLVLRSLLYTSTLGFVAHRALVPMGETDLFFHLKLGDLIRAQHVIPFRNLFSFTHPDHPDPDLAWGFQVIVSWLYSLGGFPAIVLGKSAAIVVAAALVHRTSRRRGAGPLAASACTVVLLLAADQRLVERPHLATFVGLAALSLILVEVEDGRRRLLWCVPLLVLVWANLHAGVFLAAIVLATWWIGSELDGRPPDRVAVSAILALSIAAMFCTPAGARLPRYLLWHSGLGATRNIEEFRVADPYDDPWFFVLMTVCALTLLRMGRSAGARRYLPVIVIGILAWRSVRFVAEWSFLAAPLAATGLTQAGRLASSRVRNGAALAAALGLLVYVGGERAGKTSTSGLGLESSVAPFAAIAFVTRNGLRDHLFHDLDVGCYLLWEGWPRFRVFQDARLPAYPDEFHRTLDRTPLDPASFDAVLTRYGVDAALLNYPDINMRAGSFDPEQWALVYRQPDALVFARRIPRFATFIQQMELPLRTRFRFLGGTSVEPIWTPPARSSVAVCEWQRRLASALEAEGDSDRSLEARSRALERHCLQPEEEGEVWFRLGARAQLAGRLAEAAGDYDRTLDLQPNHVSARINRGFARLRSARAAACADFSRALALDPRREDARSALAGCSPW